MGPWEKYGGAPAGGMTPLTGTDPSKAYQTTQEQYQAQAAPALARKAEADARRAEIEAQEAARKAADPKGAGAKEPSVEQGKAAGFYSRAYEANNAYQDLGVGADPLPLQAAESLLPEGVTNYFTDPKRQASDAQKRAFITAILRYESGAAIPPEEFSSADRTYFPQPGDGPEALAAKAAIRAQALEGMKMGAGPAADGLGRLSDEQYMAELSRLIQAGDRGAVDKFMAEQGAKEAVPGQIDAAISAGGGTVAPPTQAPAAPGFFSDLRDSAQNTLAGIGQGIVAIPDALVNATGATLGVVADSLPGVPEWFSDSLKNPVTLGGMIEQASPTPNNSVDKGVRFASQLTGGVLGFPQKAATGLANAVVGQVPKSPAVAALTGGSQTLAAAERQGVEMLPADVGGRGVQAMTSAAAQAPVSANSISSVARRGTEQMGAAAERVASSAGRVLPEDEAGEIARKGGQKFIEQTRQRASAWYEKAHAAAEGVKIMPQNAIRVLEEQIALKKQAGEMSGGVVSELEKVLRSLNQEGGITIVGLREARTILSSMARNDALRGTDAKRIFGMVLDAASDDMTQALVSAGKQGAANLFRRADTLWRERITEIDEVLEPVIGKAKSGEDVVAAVEAMARGSRGGVSRLGRMLATLPKAERGDLTATIIDRMGRATASAQDETGAVFSSETFLTNWSKMSAKGKAALFGGSELRQNLDDIARLAAARRDTSKLASKSNTPVGIVGNMGTLASTGLAWGPAPFVLAALQYTTGKVLAHPAYARWLARTPKAPGALKAHVGRLSAIAESNPAIAREIGSIQSSLMQAANDLGPSVGKAVASPDPRPEH